jgi:hypothetical protein
VRLRKKYVRTKKISPLSVEKRRGEREKTADLNKQETNREDKT